MCKTSCKVCFDCVTYCGLKISRFWCRVQIHILTINLPLYVDKKNFYILFFIPNHSFSCVLFFTKLTLFFSFLVWWYIKCYLLFEHAEPFVWSGFDVIPAYGYNQGSQMFLVDSVKCTLLKYWSLVWLYTIHFVPFVFHTNVYKEVLIVAI